MATITGAGGALPPCGYGVLHFRGADAGRFLQGQLSNDMNALRADALLLAGLHNPQGRVLALLRLAALAPDEIVALLPAELAEATAATLRRFVLRAQLIIGCDLAPDAPAALAARLPAVAALLAADACARDIAAGVPQVYRVTSGEFIAQMLNLDCIGAISFDKGCYTGQEIIARAHYRGRVKRRMQRFVSAGPAELVPGQAVTLDDGRSAHIVDAVTLPGGRMEFLAVAPLASSAAAGDVATAGNAAAVSAGAGAAAPAVHLAATPLPLPYALPD